MAQAQKDHKILFYEEDVYSALRDGVEDLYKAVSVTYGPKGKNVLIEKTYGRPTLTRDGVTVAKEVYFKYRPKNMAAQLVAEASMTTNRIAGDGTTATVVLTRNLIMSALKQVSAGHDPMVLRETLNKDSNTLLEEISKLSNPVKKGQLEQVATVSSGDPLLGKMIAEAVEKVGENGGIITEKAHISGVEREYVDGYYLQNGFTALTEGRRELENPFVVVSAKRISSPIDVLEILQKIVQANPGHAPRVVFIGEFEGDAYNTIIKNLMEGKLDSVILGTPSTGDMGTQYLEDIAIYTGGRVIAEGSDIHDFDFSYVGKANRVICTQTTASIFSDAAIKEDMDGRIAKLKQRLETEESEFLAEKIRDRLAKLEGKIALFKIGGATETEKEEKEFRIEDAIQASRAAYSNGVVTGGGTTLLRLSELDVSPIFKEALINTFARLVRNASFAPTSEWDKFVLKFAQLLHLRRLAESVRDSVAKQKAYYVLATKAPMGINLRKGSEIVDLVKEGVLDPTLVVEQIITNAASTAGNAITIGAMDVFEDKE